MKRDDESSLNKALLEAQVLRYQQSASPLLLCTTMHGRPSTSMV